MAEDKFLEVTRQPDALSIEPRGKAVVTYVVTNRTGSDDHVRVKLPDADPASPLTLALQQSGEQHISNGGTATFNVEVVAGSEAAPGSRDVKLEFIASQMEDQAFAASAVVVTIPPPTPLATSEPGRRFPWAIVLSIGGVVLLAGGLLIGVKLSAPAHTGKACGDASDCANGHVCTTAPGSGDGETVCLRAQGQGCDRDADCATGYCRTGGGASAAPGQAAAGAPECRARAAAGAACELQQDCDSPASCVDGRCRLATGEACASDAACESGLCGRAEPDGARECLALPGLAARCTADRRCGPGLTCAGVEGSYHCLVGVGGECFGDDLCASAFCSRGRCAESPPLGAACVESRCGLGMSCDGGVCLKPGGLACGRDAECVSRRCSDGRCASLGQLMDRCSSNQQCAGLVCERGQCLRPLEAACAADPECGSGMCSGRRCQRPRREGESCSAALRCDGALQCASGICRPSKKRPLWLGTQLQMSEALQAASKLQESKLQEQRLGPQRLSP